MSRLARSVMRALLLALPLVFAPAVTRAQDLVCDPGDREVRGVRFSGNRTFRATELHNAIATTASSAWRRVLKLPFGPKRCLDRLELQRDVVRLRIFYRQRGFYETRVDTTLTTLEPGVVVVRFQINEGPPVLVDSLTVTGVDSMSDASRLQRLLRPLEGARFDRNHLEATINAVLDRLKNAGYARASVLRSTTVDETRNRATVELQFLPGKVAKIADIKFDIQAKVAGKQPEISEGEIRGIISLEEGEIFRERDLFRSQRDLYRLETYRHVEIGLAPDSVQPEGDSLLVVQVRLSEADMRTVRLGVGWGTLDCFRLQGRLTDRDFLGRARRLELNGRLSKIGRGEPLDGAEPLCHGDIRTDRFSDTVNYYLGGTIRQPTLFGARVLPSLTLFSERRSEVKAYLRSTPIGGITSVTLEPRPRTPLTLAYQMEFGRTEAEDAVFCAAFNVCDLSVVSALKEDATLAVFSAALSRDRTDNTYDPRRGDQIRLETRHASRLIGSDAQFNKWQGEGSYYRAVGRSSVIAARLLIGGVLALGSLRGTDQFVPPQERLYGGGANSVRGYKQNELGPVVYLVDTFTVRSTPTGATTYQATPDSVGVTRTSPTGGNSLLVTNLELRTRMPFLRELFQWAFFVDAGQVYNRGRETVRLRNFRWTPGLGVRIASPVGPIRFDLAYNRYEAQPGSAYYQVRDPVTGIPTQLLCVSPRNTLERGIGGSCPTTFAPPRNDTFFERLTFHFNIGQAF